MSINIKLQLLRGLRNNLPATTGFPGVLAWTTDTDELFIDTGLVFKRLAAANQVWTITDPSQLSGLTSALIGDVAVVMSGSPAVPNGTYMLVESGSPVVDTWVLIAGGSEQGGGVDVTPLAGATAHEFVTYIDASGVQHLAQPSFADISGQATQQQLPSVIDLGTF